MLYHDGQKIMGSVKGENSMPETKRLEGIIITPAEGGYVVMIESYSEEEGEDIRVVVAGSAGDVGDIVVLALRGADTSRK